MNPSNELALQLTEDWLTDQLKPESKALPRNPQNYARFKSARVYAQPSTEPVEGDNKIPEIQEMETMAEPTEDSVFNDGRFVTKTTVHRIYRDITDLVESYEDISGHMSAEIMIEEHDLEEKCEEFPIDVGPSSLETSMRRFFQMGIPQAYLDAYYEIHLANQVLPFFTLAQVVIEDYTVRLLQDNIIDEEYQGSNTTTKKLENKLSQSGREMLLQRTGLVSGNFRSDMKDVRKTRNDLVHNLRKNSYFEEVIDAISEMRTCAEIIEEFEDRYAEESFSW